MESHGIVGNSLYDPTYNERINLLSGSSKNDPKWWNKTEPIWMTARNQVYKSIKSPNGPKVTFFYF